MNVLRNVDTAVVRGGKVLDIHPLGLDLAVRAGPRGLGFVDARKWAGVIANMDEGVAEVAAAGQLEHLRTLRRLVVERFDDPAEAIEEAESWENFRLPAVVKRRLRAAEERPIEFVDTVRYRLFRTPP